MGVKVDSMFRGSRAPWGRSEDRCIDGLDRRIKVFIQSLLRLGRVAGRSASVAVWDRESNSCTGGAQRLTRT